MHDDHALNWRQMTVILDTVIWYVYLVVLVAVSFINQIFPSEHWFLVAGVVFALSGLNLLSSLFGGRCNRKGVFDSRIAISIIVAMMLLLLAQCVLPGFDYGHSLLFPPDHSLAVPAWFNPEFKWSIVPEKTRLLLISELIIFTTFVLSVSLVCTRRRIIQLLFVLTMIGLIHAIIGIVAKYGNLALVDIKQLDGHYTAARAWFINRNHFAAFISLTMFSALALQIRTLIAFDGQRYSSVLLNQLLSHRVLYLSALILGLTALVLSQSRAGFLSLIVALLVVFLGLGRNASKFGSRRRILIPSFLLTVLLLAYFGGDLLARFSFDSGFLGERAAQWAFTFQAIKSAWLTGYGGNSYADVFQIVRGYANFRDVVFNQAHNDYLHIWLEQGLIGLCLWLGLIAVTLRRAYIAFLHGSSSLVNACMLAAGVVLIAALLQSFVDFNLQILNIRYYFFVIMSLPFSVPAIRQRKGKRRHSVLV